MSNIIKIMALFCIKTEPSPEGRELCANVLVNCAVEKTHLDAIKAKQCMDNYKFEKNKFLKKIKQFEEYE